MRQSFGTLCIECKETIQNPICPHCLGKEISAWMEGKSARTKNILQKEIRRILSVRKLSESDRCIICGEKSVFICPYCFAEIIYKRLSRENIDKNELVEFLTFFNFKFENTYLSREAERLGVF